MLATLILYLGLFTYLQRYFSRVCAVAQYAVLEANANGERPIYAPPPPKTLNQFRCHVKYITTSPQGVDVQNLVGIDSAVTDLRMRENHVLWIFLLTYLSVCLSVRIFVGATGHSFGAIFTLNSSNDVISQPLLPFGGHTNIAPY